tara:strand:+ start:12193 stop:12945 length:753 start_codon:yes stop_codon:yes gene_type:complete
MKNIKKLLKKNELTIGSWITIPDPIIVEMMCKAKFDWLALDLEHSAIGMESMQDIIRIITLYDIFPFVRLTSNDANQIKRVMDAGALGIIVPMVKTVEDIKIASEGMYYPNKGKRSVGLARAQEYGRDLQGYIKSLNKYGTLIVQIEHIDAVNNIEEIFSNENIDGYFIGPNDLSASMGIPGDLKNIKLKKAISYIKDKAKEHNIPGGQHIIEPNIKELSKAKRDGFKFIGYSLDIRIFDKSLEEFNRSF